MAVAVGPSPGSPGQTGWTRGRDPALQKSAGRRSREAWRGAGCPGLPSLDSLEKRRTGLLLPASTCLREPQNQLPCFAPLPAPGAGLLGCPETQHQDRGGGVLPPPAWEERLRPGSGSPLAHKQGVCLTRHLSPLFSATLCYGSRSSLHLPPPPPAWGCVPQAPFLHTAASSSSQGPCTLLLTPCLLAWAGREESIGTSWEEQHG